MDKKLYTEELAKAIRESGKNRYRPSNGTEGEMFMELWCYRCVKDNYPNGPFCEIIASSLAFDVDDQRYPAEWTYRDGQPCCTAFVER